MGAELWCWSKVGAWGYCETNWTRVQTDPHGLLRKHVDQIQTWIEPDIVSNSDNMEKVHVLPIQPTEEIQQPDREVALLRKIILSLSKKLSQLSL